MRIVGTYGSVLGGNCNSYRELWALRDCALMGVMELWFNKKAGVVYSYNNRKPVIFDP